MEKNNLKDISSIENRLEELKKEKEELLQTVSKIDGAYLSSYEIRPTGRHLLTIGEDLIQDQYAAIVELVKNCYDADSPDATIVFKKILDEDCLEIRIEDHGHGMSTEDVINKWLVPSTNYKLEARKSPRGRIMQGRKGIGRYASSILADDLTLITIDKNGIETTAYIQWHEISKYKYLDQIKIPVKRRQTEKSSGTTLIMRSKLSENNYWNDDRINKLRFELKKLIPPKPDNLIEEEFKIFLKFVNFYDNEVTEETINPYPILDYYDYRIYGKVSKDGIGDLFYENHKIKNAAIEKIELNKGNTQCGAIEIDIRVYDRDKDSINQLISRGLRDENGNYVSKLQARHLLDSVNGIGVYRNGFRIRPLGDPEFDWLKLGGRRVQNPSMRIGSNQVVGYVHIQSEEDSGLEEKSARDGLKNNEAYEALKRITIDIIRELEAKRFNFRRQMDISLNSNKNKWKIEKLYSTDLSDSVSKTLKTAEVSEDLINQISDIISKDNIKKNEYFDDIKQDLAIYQGQATLGKIINIILHEGRRPLSYFKNQIPNLEFYIDEFAKKRDDYSYEKIRKIANGIGENAQTFVKLFSRLDPLAAKKRETKHDFSICDAIEDALDIYKTELENNDIHIDLQYSENIVLNGWKEDIFSIFVNLIDNSIYWMLEKECKVKKISINGIVESNGFKIDYYDTGPGISDEFLNTGVIFTPEFTTKPDGMGLGLAIAGEAANRNGLSITAAHIDNGVHFIISTQSEDS